MDAGNLPINDSFSVKREGVYKKWLPEAWRWENKKRVGGEGIMSNEGERRYFLIDLLEDEEALRNQQLRAEGYGLDRSDFNGSK